MARDEQWQHAILIHFGELGLKGRNQPMFRRQLRRNIRLRLRALGLNWPVRDAVGVLTIDVPAMKSEALKPVLQALSKVPGVVWLTGARRLQPHRFTSESRTDDLAELERHVLELAHAQYSPGKTFCVRVNRGNKRLPLSSPELAAHLGQAIRDHTPWDKVSLKNPDIIFHLDVRCAATFLFGEKLRGPGGLPVGTSGRVLSLLSGGIDSPVATYLMAKRGCRIDFLHFTTTSLTQEEILNSKIWRLARHLSQYTLGGRLILAPYAYFDLALMRQKLEFDVVLFRRFMVRVAERLAGPLRARALVTGDTLSQVASQTMTNLISTSEASTLPVLRPILAFNKEETIALAQQIGTYPISIEPYKDCCALISTHPKTRSRPEKLLELENRAFPDYENLIQRTLAEATWLDTSLGEPAGSVLPAAEL